MAEHIHWKKTTNPNYLGEWDFEDGYRYAACAEGVKKGLTPEVEWIEIGSVQG